MSADPDRHPAAAARRFAGWAVAGMLALTILGLLFTVLVHRDRPAQPVDFQAPPKTTSVDTALPVPFVAAQQLLELPAVTTEATISAAPHDGHPGQRTAGVVAHNRQQVPVFTAPGGTAFARLPPQQLGNDTWLPVISQQPGWVQVLLPSRPNGSVGWLDTGQLTLARTRHTIRVDLGAARLHLLRDGRPVTSWSVSTGTAQTPTPTGRTFLLAAITDPQQAFSPLILPLGIHSTALDTYAGGPGTVGIHGWPPGRLTGSPASHGCIRVPATALKTLAGVPLGSLVHIDAR